MSGRGGEGLFSGSFCYTFEWTSVSNTSLNGLGGAFRGGAGGADTFTRHTSRVPADHQRTGDHRLGNTGLDTSKM